jgi:AraC-like DNA-binding protein
MYIHKIIHKVGKTIKLGLSIFDMKDQTAYFEPGIGSRIFALSLFVDQKLISQLIENNIQKEEINSNFNFSKKNIFYNTAIDADSLLLLTALKHMAISTTSYDTNLRGISLKLLANTFSKLAESKSNLSKIDIEGLIKTKEYLSSNIYNSFPSIDFLSKMAGMSTTKFKLLFKKYFKNTSKNLFIQEKMILANQLLQSGDYSTLNEVIREINYYKLDHFSNKYFDFFKRKPADDFVKKGN